MCSFTCNSPFQTVHLRCIARLQIFQFMVMKKILLSALLMVFYFYGHTQVGSPDPSFGKNGIQLINSNTNNFSESAIKVLPVQSGGFFMLIDVRPPTVATTSALVVKYTADGIVDTSFGTDGFSEPVRLYATDATLQPDGKIVVVGYGTSFYFPNAAFVVVRYNTDGTLDPTFSDDGIQLTYPLDDNSKATGVAMQGNNILVSGHLADGQFRVARYLPDGSLDANFGTGGIATTNFPQLNYQAYTTGILIQVDKIIVAGSFQNRFVLTRFNNDGTIDNSFNAAGTPGLMITDLGFTTSDAAITSQGDKIIAAGSSMEEFIVARFNYDGSLDNSFSNDGTAAIDFTSAIAQDVIISGNKIVVGGSAGVGFAIARLNEDGSIDNSLSGDGKLITVFPGSGSARGLALASQGNRLIVAGQADFLDVSTQHLQQDFAVAQYNADGSLDNSFSGDGMLTNY